MAAGLFLLTEVLRHPSRQRGPAPALSCACHFSGRKTCTRLSNKIQTEEHKVAPTHDPFKALFPHSFFLLQIPTGTHACTMLNLRNHFCSGLTSVTW